MIKLSFFQLPKEGNIKAYVMFLLRYLHPVEQITFQWDIIPKGNGKCEIKKMDVEQYLSWQEGEDNIIRVIIAPKPVVWLVKSIGGFAYSYAISAAGNLQYLIVSQCLCRYW